jgi:hypothetical protein
MTFVLNMEQEEKLTLFLKEIVTAVNSSDWLSVTLSQPRDKAGKAKSLYFRPLELKGKIVVQMVVRYKDKEETKNFNIPEFLAFASQSIRQHFYYAHLITPHKEGHLLISKRGFVTLKWKKTIQKETPTLIHDKEKSYTIPPNAPFFHRLGISSKEGVVLPSQFSKYKQICRYVELLFPLLESLNPGDSLTVADMGCGKGYLTFALHQYLMNSGFAHARTIGVDLKEEVIHTNNQIAHETNMEGLEFIYGDIASTVDLKTDMLIALHACNTATDEAIFYGLQQKAKIIVVAPCCHKQVRKSMESNDVTGSLFRYGIIQERFASDLTDLIRANVLKYYGYQVKVMEFVNVEHTPKNIMITAEYKGNVTESARTEVENWMKLFGIREHYLLQKLGWSNKS